MNTFLHTAIRKQLVFLLLFFAIVPGMVAQTVLFSEDFNGSLPAEWTNTVIDGPSGFPGWEWTDIGGAYGGQLNSTTAANGYLILDSDQYGQSGMQEDVELISPSIDCSDKDIISLSVEHYARTFGNADISIYISSDNFVTEELVYNWVNGAVNDGNGTNPVLSNFYISEFAAGESNVKIKFKWQGEYDYWWLIDDVEVIGLDAPAGNLTDLVYWLRGDLGVTGANPVTDWADQSGNGNDATPNSIGPDQIISANMNSKQVMAFDGNNDLNITNDARINGGTGYDGSERTMFVAFQTGADVSTTQYIYEEGGGTNGIGVFVKNYNVYVTIYNDGNTNNRTTIFEAVSANTTYVLSFNWYNGALSAYLNNVPFSNQTSNGSITNLKSHTGDISIGFTGGTTRDENGNSVNGGQNFSGEIAEVLYYDVSLLEEEELDITIDLADRYGISFDPITTYYSYQTGNWDASSTWTHDPGGTTQTATDSPGENDKVVLLSGRTVTLIGDVTQSNLDITIRAGATLNQSTYTFKNGLLAFAGTGTFKLASINFPTIVSNEFVNSDGGTTEYYNATNFTLPVAQTEYNNLRINAPGVTATQLSNITLNGNLHVKQGTYQINDNSANRRQLIITSNVLVDNGASIITGTGNTLDGDVSGGTAPFIDYYDKNSHRVVVNGDFTNNGTVKFTNQSYPKYDAFPANGMATVYFMGATDNTITCKGTTDFYNLVLNKGIDQTYKLTVYSTAYNNFRLFGRNNLGAENDTDNPNMRKALWLRAGTLELTGLTVVPSLTESVAMGKPGGDFYIPVNGALVLNGPEVLVLNTADDYQDVNVAYNVAAGSNNDMGIEPVGGRQSMSIYGKLQVDNGYFSTRESAGIVTWDHAAGELVINGGVVDAKQFRADGDVGGLASFRQNGGEFLLRGRFQRTPVAYDSISDLKDFSASTLNTDQNANALVSNLGTFNLNEPENVFSMTGGAIRIYDVCGTGHNKAFQVFSDDANNNVTGGTLEIIPTTGTGTDATTYEIESTADLGNLTINRTDGAATVQLVTYTLTVLKNVTIAAGDFIANDLDLTIGGDFTLESGTTYDAGTNTTEFNGTNNQSITMNTGGAIDFHNFSLNNVNGKKLTLNGSDNVVIIANALAIQKGELADNGKTINVTGDIYNAGTHNGDGKIVLNGSVDQVINGTGNGVFGNIELNNTSGSTAPVSLGASATINGTLTFSQDKLFDISTHKLTLGQGATVANAGGSRFIQTAGTAGDGGITKVYATGAPSFSFPLGTISTSHTASEFTPATIAFTTNPTTFGSITVLPIGYEHPNTTTKDRSVTYFWRVKSEGFDLGTGTVSHSFQYAQSDVVNSGNVSEAEYVAAKYDNSAYSWTTYATGDVNTTTNTIGGAGSALEAVNFIDGEFTAGDNLPTDPFGEPIVFYSRINGLDAGNGRWDDGDHWSTDDNLKHEGAAAGDFPEAGDIAIIGGKDSIFLLSWDEVPDRSAQEAATLKIEEGAALDIGYNPGSNFSVVLNHGNGNGNFRLTCDRGPLAGSTVRTFEFPSGDYSDFNTNQGTTELYTTNPVAGTTFYLPNGVESYGSLIISPLGGSNIIFPNNDLLIYGDLITRGQNSESWYCPNWRANYPTTPTPPIAKTITINGDFHMQGGALVWYSWNNTGEQDFVVGGNLILDSETGVKVHTNGNGNSQSITIGGSLINNTLAPGGGVNEYRGADFTDIPLIFSGAGIHSITNDDPADNTYTVIESLTVNKGDSQTDELVVDITGAFTTPADNWLTLVNGTFKYLHDDDLTITEGSEFTIPSTAGLFVNSPGNRVYLANDNVDDNDVYLQGKLTVIDGDVYVGQTGAPNNNNDIEYSGGGDSEIDIQGGSLIVNGQIRRNPATSAGILQYSQSGGAVTINGNNHNTDNAKLEILNEGSTFNMSGGTLTIVRGGGAGTYGDLYLRPEISSVTGGEIVFNPDDANENQNYIFDANVPVWNLTINGTDGYDANVKLLVSSLTLKNDLLINNAGTLDANVNFDIPVTIKGDFTNNGAYAHQRNLTTFSGGEQIISGTSAITFYDAVVAPVTSALLGKEITVNHDLTLSRGTLSCDTYYVNVEGDVTNNANYTDTNSGIILNGRDLQYVDGTGTWGQLELDNASGARLGSSITLQNNLVLTSGVFDVNSELLTLGEAADIIGTNYSISKMITSDGTFSDVGVSKNFSSLDNNSEFLFPLGTSGKYTPVNLTIDNIGNSGSIRVNNINDHHPGVIDVNNVLAYFWDVENTGITDFSGSVEFNYIDDDVKVGGVNSEAEYIGAHLFVPGTSWSKIDNVDEAVNTITFTFSNSGSLSGEYTAGIDEALPDEVPEFISNQSGNWSNPDIWDQVSGDAFTLTGAPNGFILTIDETHTVTTNTDYVSAYRLQIRGTLDVTNGTYGHNMGTVTGAGRLYLENGTFPAGRFDSFFDCANNSTLEYGGSSSYDLIADLYESVPNLLFTGSGSRTLPNKDLTICKQLLIDGATVDNSANNRKLTVLGTMERYSSGAFVSGTGANATVAFAGSAAQTMGGALGDFTGSNAFNNLEIDNPAGLTINESGDIEVGGKLLLTDGLINTSETNQLAITNTSGNSVAPAGGQSNSFVNGPMTKTIIQGDNFNFPIGKDGELGNKLVLSASEAGTIDWTVEYFTPNNTYTSYNAPLSYVNSYDRWVVSAANGSKAKVGIKWDANSDLTPANTQYGNSDMRVAKYDENNSVWNELSSSATGSNILGTVTTVSKVTIPTEGYSLFSTACINTIKPRAKFTPTGPVCGTTGIPVSFSSSPTLEYLLSYTLNGVTQSDIAVTSTPFVLPTQPGGGVYKLTAFTYSNGTKTGAVDQSEITAYQQPEVPDAGEDQSLCGGTQANISGSSPSVGSVLWDIASGAGGSFVAPTSESTVFNGTNGSGYTLTYTVDNSGCTASDELDIDFPVLAAQPSEFIVASQDVCQTESGVEFTVPNDATVSYNWNFNNDGDWNNGDDNLIINGSGNSITADFSTVAADGTIQVVASNACGDSDPRAIDITIHSMPQITFESDDNDNVICDGSDITFTVAETSGLSVADYDFMVDGVSLQNGTNTDYTTNQLTNGAEVHAVVTSNEGCATTSNVFAVAVGNRIWDGQHNENWNDNGNWTCGNKPSDADAVVIPPAPTRMPVIRANAECGGLTVKAGAIVTLEGTKNFDIYGNWNNEGTFNANEGTVNFKGNVKLSGSANLTFNHLTIGNGITVTSSDNILNITGDFTNNGTFVHNSGTVTFNGAAEQSIAGEFTGANTLNNVVIANASGVNLASGDKQIDGILTLTNGVLTSNGLLILGQNATTNISAASGKVSSYIEGALSKVILGNDYFFFPVGSGALYKPVGITAVNSPSTNTWTAEYNNAAPAEYSIKDGEEILRVSNQESWTLSSTASEATIQLAWDAVFNGDIYIDTDQLNSLRVAHLNNSNEWETVGSGSFSGSGASFGTVTSGNTIVFDGSKAGSEIVTLATTSSEYHPLPVELADFYGKAQEGNVKLSWTTLSETDNDYFEVQHSTDAQTFTNIGTVRGAGNSTEELHYTLTDNSPVRGVNYYRLKQVDYDGSVELHRTIAVHFEGISLFDDNSVSVYPNPYSNGDLTLEFSSVEPNTPVVITVTSLDGAMVFQTTMELPYGGKIVNPMAQGFDQLAKGIYLIHVKTTGNTVVKRLMVY